MAGRASLILLAASLLQCEGKEVKKMLDEEFSALEKLSEQEYIKTRDALISKRAQEVLTAQAGADAPIPNLRAAAGIRAREPKKSRKYTGALTGENKEFLNPRAHAQTASPEAIANYLGRFGDDFLPLVEEYLFKYVHLYASNSIQGAAILYLKSNPGRGKNIFSACFAAQEKFPVAQDMLLGGAKDFPLDELKASMWKAYRKTDYGPLRSSIRYLLAKSGDPEMRSEVKAILAGDSASAEDREDAATAFIEMDAGNDFERAVRAFRHFQRKDSKRALLPYLSAMSKEDAEQLKSLIRETTDEGLRADLEDRLSQFRERMR